MGKFLYSTGYMYRTGGRHNRKTTYELEDENYSEVSIQRAFFFFIEEMLKPYYHRVRRDFSDFREDKLWDQSVETCYTMNEKAITALYNHYAKMNWGVNGKPYNADFMTVNECISLFKFDSPLKLTRGIIRQAFALCKMTVINETDKKSQV